MKNKTFEEFLQEMFMNMQPQVLDDDLPDAFDNWLGNLDGEQYMEWGELYGRSQYLAGKTEILNDK